MNDFMLYIMVCIILGLIISLSVFTIPGIEEKQRQILENQAEIIRLLQPDIAIDIVECEEINMPKYKKEK